MEANCHDDYVYFDLNDNFNHRLQWGRPLEWRLQQKQLPEQSWLPPLCQSMDDEDFDDGGGDDDDVGQHHIDNDQVPDCLGEDHERERLHWVLRWEQDDHC